MNHTPINCEAFNDHLADYLAGELEPEARASCEDHLRSCAACRALVAPLADMHARLRAAGGTLEQAEARAQVVPPPRPMRLPRTATRVALAASLVIAFGAGVLVGRPAPAAPRSNPAPLAQNHTPRPSGVSRVAQEYLKASQAAPTANPFGWALISIARR